VQLSRVPAAAWVCLTVAFVAVVGAFAWLSAIGADGTEFRSFLNTVVNLATLAVAGGGVVFAGQAAKQTNGDLDQRIKDGVTAALDRQRLEDTGTAVPLRDDGELRRAVG
jgi:hypothetical protein